MRHISPSCANAFRLALLALFLLPRGVRAISTAPNSNTPIQCTSGVEVYYPRGDAWAFLPAPASGSCHGTDPVLIGASTGGDGSTGGCTAQANFSETSVIAPCTATNWVQDPLAVDPLAVGTGSTAGTGDKPEDTPGHCLWVFFSDGAPRCTNNCPPGGAGAPDSGELANQMVFADMRKWTGYNSGQQQIPGGTANLQWTCPELAAAGGSSGGSSSGGSTGVATPTPSFQTATLDYTFGNTNGMPSVSFYRGQKIARLDSDGNYNKGDNFSCYAQCLPGSTCSDECTASSNPPCTPTGGTRLFDCISNKNAIDTTTQVYRFDSVRNVVQYVNGSGDWASKLQYDAATLAVTETIFWPDTGVSITSDMMINNDNVDWAWKDISLGQNHSNFGCDFNSDTSCYFLETVTTHESGHFIGFGHTDCQGSVMYSTADTDTEVYSLGIGEQAGVCALYRPDGSNMATTTAPFTVAAPIRELANGKSRENEGCFLDTDCADPNPAVTGLKCIFSSSSFYQLPGESLTTVKANAAKIPHRGICARTCSSVGSTDPANSDCAETSGTTGKANYYGHVCQPYNADGSVAYCLPGSPYKPSDGGAGTTDLCAACASASDCSSEICLNLAATGIPADKLAEANAPASICSVRCYPASGCDNNYDCLPASSGAGNQTYGCVPHAGNLAACIAAHARRELDESCDQNNGCDTGLVCYGLVNGNACLQGCDADTPCGTSNYACLYPTVTDAQGNKSTSTVGACFREKMEEGDACVLPEAATCGLTCTTDSSGNQTCVENPSLGCFGTPPAYADAACYALCSTNDTSVPCPHSGQTCVADPNYQNLGVCEPLAKHICLLATGVQCNADADCETGSCLEIGPNKTCTNACDLATKSGCPTGTACQPSGQGSSTGACQPTGKPLPSNCPPVQGAGCGCASTTGPNALEGLAALAVVLVLRRQRRSRSGL